MRMRRPSLAAGLLSLTLSAAALAQEPQPNHFSEPSLFTQPDSVPAEQSSLLNGTCPDGWHLDWQWRFQADALYLKRNNHWRDIPVISGPESFSPSNLNFDYKAGTRLSLGIMQEDFEMDFVFTTLNDWNASQSGVLTNNAVDFDGLAAYTAADQAAKDVVDAGGSGPNFINSNTYFAPINTAALTGAEANELEFLRPGARFSQSFNSNYQDFEVNYKRRAQPGRFARFGFGYRNVQFGESGLTALSGTFDTVDSATGGEALGNNGLLNGSLVSGGLTAPTPALLAVGFSENTLPTPPDELLFTTSLRATNQLNGVHLTSDFLFFESEYFELGGFGKAGVFHNFASGSITERYSDTLNDPNSVYTRTLSSKKEVASFLGQAGLTGRLFLRDNVRLFGSYEAIYLSGLALAPDQMRGISTSVTPAASLDLRTQGSVFIHGGRIGVEILWP
ncbi:MAG: hypothetical protein IAG10_20595 [Planctomycetaceae bacterium]|nr:hypothetical protein [Planctomycetaceae bacterium]